MAVKPTDFVKEPLLKEKESWKIEGSSDEDIIQRLRVRTVPPGYSTAPWTPGIIEAIVIM